MVLQPGLYVQCCLVSYPESRTLTLAIDRKPYMSLANRCEVHVKPLQALMILRPTPSPHKFIQKTLLEPLRILLKSQSYRTPRSNRSGGSRSQSQNCMGSA